MRRFWLRIGFRTLMIAISAVAVMLGIGTTAARLKARSSAHRARAAEYAFQEELFAKHIKWETSLVEESERIDRECSEEIARSSGMARLQLMAHSSLFRTQAINVKKKVARSQAKADWYAMMKTRYQFAGSHPWLSVPPDPPEPK